MVVQLAYMILGLRDTGKNYFTPLNHTQSSEKRIICKIFFSQTNTATNHVAYTSKSSNTTIICVQASKQLSRMQAETFTHAVQIIMYSVRKNLKTFNYGN